MSRARCWLGRCTEPPSFRLVPPDPALPRPEACRAHLGDLVADTLERSRLDVVTIERIPAGSAVDGVRQEPAGAGAGTRTARRGRFTGMQEVARPDCGHRLLVAMYRHRLDSPEAVARAREIALSQPCPTCRKP